MTNPIDSSLRASLVVRETTPRMTAPPPSRTFADAVSRSGRAFLETAISAAAQIPGGGPMLSAALRGVAAPALATARPSGPYGTAEAPAALPANAAGASPTSTSSSGGLGDDVLTRGQEMSMQMLRLQEAVGEENRRYTALSNVLHARHEMAKNAIGNIR